MSESTMTSENTTCRVDGMNFYTRKWVRPEDLNANGSLFGGSLLKWIDEEAAIYAIIQLGSHTVVTRLISEINFEASARQGDLIEMGLVATHFGRTSITMRAQVRNMITRKSILSIEKIGFVSVGGVGAAWAPWVLFDHLCAGSHADRAPF